MAWQVCLRALSLAAIAAGVPLFALQTVGASEANYCVTCKNPDQTYVCSVDAGGRKAGDAMKLYCIIRIAKEGHHGSCAAEQDSGGCRGVQKVYSYDGPMPEDLASDPRVKHFTDKIKRDQQTFDKKPTGDQPKTLVELTGRAVSASRKGLRNARGALGGSSDQPLPDDPPPLNPSEAPLTAETPPAVESADASPSRAQKTGSAVGGFARKSYRCMLSLFRNCSSDDAPPQ
jgi:hypothetical protein